MTFPNLENTKTISIDIETHDPKLKTHGSGARDKNAYICGVAVATKDQSWYFSLQHPHSKNIPEPVFFSWFNTLQNKNIILANALYDLDFLQYKGFHAKRILDVQSAEPLINENAKSFSLDALALKYLGIGKQEQGLEEFALSSDIGKSNIKANIFRMPAHVVEPYAKADAELTFKVLQKQWPILESEGLLPAFDIESRLIKVLLQMKKTGVLIDSDAVQKARKALADQCMDAQRELDKKAGRSIAVFSAADVAWLFDKNNIPYSRTAKGAPSFTKEFLEGCAHPLANDVLEIRQLSRLGGTFVEGLSKFAIDSRIHSSFHPLRTDEYGTVSHRFSSSTPNLQQIPSRQERAKKILRSLFIPEPDHIWGKNDYAQIELRLLLHYAQGPAADAMRAEYAKNPAMDLHQFFANMIGISRSYCKSINFGIVYGMGIKKLCLSLGLSEDQGKLVLNKYHQKLPFLRKLINEVQKRAEGRGYIKMISGARARFGEEGRSIHTALNRLLQGSAAYVMKKAMVDCYDAGLFNPGYLIPHLTVHDELDYSIPITKQGFEAVAELENIFCATYDFKVPIITDTEAGENWYNVSKEKFLEYKRSVA